MRKLLLVLVLSLSACSLFDKQKPCPPVVVCPPPVVCPTPEPTEVPTPCPTPEPTPAPTECPPIVICPPPVVCPPPPVPTPCPPCPTPSPTPVPTPEAPPRNAVIIYDAEPQCPPMTSTFVLPSRAKTDCIQRNAGQALKNIILTKRIQPNPKSPCYPFFGQMYENCIDVAVSNYPGITYGLSGHYLKGMLNGQPWEGCAAGVSGNPIRVTLAQPPRELALIAWESANWWMWTTMDRMDLTDGDYIAQATNTAMTACSAVN